MGPSDLRVPLGRAQPPRRRRAVRVVALFAAGLLGGVLAALFAPIQTTEDE